MISIRPKFWQPIENDIRQWFLQKRKTVSLYELKKDCSQEEEKIIDYVLNMNWEDLLFPSRYTFNDIVKEIKTNDIFYYIRFYNKIEKYHKLGKELNQIKNISKYCLKPRIAELYRLLLSQCGIKQEIHQDSFDKMKKQVLDTFEKIYRVSHIEKCLGKLFDYNYFRYCFGARFVELSGLTSCPYCDRVFINQYNGKTKRTNAELDHFFPKSIYPFWAVSPWNLIPACHTCNALLKNDRNPINEPILNPYQINGNEIRFSQKLNDMGYLYDNSNHFDIEIDAQSNEAQNSVKVFHLYELYQSHKNYIANIARLKRIQTDLMREETAKLLGTTINEISQIFDTVFETIKHQQILSKLTKEIMEDLDKIGV